MPEKKHGGQVALFIAGSLLIAVILFFVFFAGPDEGNDQNAAPGVAKTDVPNATSPSGSAAKKRVEEKLKKALSPALAAARSDQSNFYLPARSRTPLDERGRIPAMTAPRADAEPLDITQEYLQSTEAGAPLDQGWTGPDMAAPIVMSETSSRHNGVTHLYLRQQVDGIEVYNGDLNANIGKDGSILSLNNGFVKDVVAQINRRQPQISAAEAIEQAATHVQAGVVAEAESMQLAKAPEGPAQEAVFEGGNLSFDPIPAKLVYVARPENETRLAWNLVMHLRDGVRWLDLTIDAENGELLTQANWYANADYQVFAKPKEHPNDGPRTLEIDPHDLASSPQGWHDTNGAAGAEFNTTQGNNVYAQEDTDANNSGGRRPNGGAGLVFNHPLNLGPPGGDAPAAYEDAAITNLFYWNNIIHDILWHYGFDEASGNFQENNYGNGGNGSDHVWADAQDGSGTNNANFGTPPDGSNPRMQMFVWTQANPDRDSDLDNGIIIHEYGHGISNRLTGGAANSSALSQSQSRGMGEGWSDWWGLVLTSVASDTSTTERGIGTYVLNQQPDGAGIRPYRYTTDFGENPQTYGDLDDGGLSVPHGVGSVWCTTIWEVYWELVAAHGWDPNPYTGTGGNNIAMQLVIDGMKFQGANPSFLDARDAIILADETNNAGANVDIIWRAFAKRGMGFSAFDGGDASHLDVTEAFDIPNEAISITDVSVVEGDTGSVDAVFTVSLDMASPDEEIRVDYASENGPAVAPGDFTAVSGQLIFPIGDTEKTITVPVNGDATPEEDETFIIRLSNPINAYISNDAGTGTILNDDYIHPVITSSLTASGFEAIPFTYTITADNTPRTFSIGTPVPPAPGLTIDTATGVISWPSPVIGAFNIDITATNPSGSDTKPLAITMAENPVLTAIDASGLPISSSPISWFNQSVTTHDGIDAAQSGDVDDGEFSWAEVDITGPDTALFWWKVSSEGGWDFLTLSLDGVPQQSISGEIDWQRIILDIPAGTHSVRWNYAKDGSVSNGSDAGWVDELILASQDPRPFITSAQSVSGIKGMAFNYQIETVNPATSFSSGSLPAGLSLHSSTGLISGTPSASGSADVAITATNGAGSDQITLSFTILEIAAFPFSDDFESGVIGPTWTVTGTNEFRTEVTQANGPPQSGSWHLLMDDNFSGGAYSRNEATLSIDLAGQSGVSLSFWARDFGDESDGPPSSPFIDGADFDGVAISEDGVTWYEVQGLREDLSSEWAFFNVDLDAAIAAHGLAFNDNFRIRFNQYDNFSAPTDGIAIDDVIVGKKAEKPDMKNTSDSGSSDTDDVTNVTTPDFTGTGLPGAAIALNSDVDGNIGNGTVNGSGDWTIASSSLTEGIHEITATEDAGVPSDLLILTIDVTGPTVSVNQAAGQPDATTETVLDFSAVFDESAPTFGVGDVQLGGSVGPSSAPVVNEMPPNDGTTYNVEVTGMPGDGTVTVSVGAGLAVDIAGNPSQASISTDNQIIYRVVANSPDGLSASDEAFSDKIQVTWNLVANADGGYRVFRNTTNNFGGASQIGATLEGVTTLNDSTAIPETTYFYWVKSSRKFVEALSPESGSDGGVRGVDESDDTPGTATDLGIPGSGNTTENGNTLENFDNDFFKFELEWRAHAKIYTEGLLDTTGTLLESDGTTQVNDPAEDDNAHPDGHNFEIDELLDAGEYFVRVSGAGNNQSGQYDVIFEITGPLNFQPDRQLGTSPAAMLGDNFYSDTGAGQTQTKVSKKLRIANFYGRVENDGNFADDLTMQGTRGTRLFQATYFDETGNVTAQMVAGTLVKSYEAGEGEATQILVKPSKKLKKRIKKRNGKKKIKYLRKQFTAVVTATSGMEGTQKDVVKAVTKTK